MKDHWRAHSMKNMKIMKAVQQCTSILLAILLIGIVSGNQRPSAPLHGWMYIAVRQARNQHGRCSRSKQCLQTCRSVRPGERVWGCPPRTAPTNAQDIRGCKGADFRAPCCRTPANLTTAHCASTGPRCWCAQKGSDKFLGLKYFETLCAFIAVSL